MAEFLITGPDGSKYRITGPDDASPSAALQQFFSSQKPKESAINEGDWAGLQQRLNTTEQRVKDSGPYRPQDIDATLKGEAQRQGVLYGQERGAQEGSGGIFGGSSINTYALGLPRYLEAVTNPTVKTAYAHEFLKGADEGRAKAAPWASGLGTAAGYVGQALTLPASGAATIGGRALTAAAQGGALGAAESAIESRGDIGKTLAGGAWGFGLGGAASAGTEKLIQAGRRVIDPLRGLAKSGPADEQATARILLAAKNAGIDDATAQRKLAELGPEGFIADLLGAKGQGLARAAANVSPDARELLENASRARLDGQQGRLVAALEDAASGIPLGKTAQGPMPRFAAESIEDAQDAIFQAAKPKVAQAYEAAYNAGFAQDAKGIIGKDLMDLPRIQAAFKKAVTDTRERIAASGPHEGSQLAIVDAVSRILNKQGYGAEADEIAKKLGAIVRQRADDAIPEFGGARELAQGYKQRQAALEAGEQLGATRLKPKAFKEAGQSQYPGEIGQGYAIAKINEINNRKAGKLTVDMLDGTPSQKRALMAALGDKAKDVSARTAAERQFLAFSNALSGNSTTTRQLAELGVIGGTAGGAAMTGFDPMQAGTIAGAAVMARRGGSKLMEALAKKNEAAVAPEVARKLIERALPKLIDKNGKPISETARRRLVEALMSGGIRGTALGYSQN